PNEFSWGEQTDDHDLAGPDRRERKNLLLRRLHGVAAGKSPTFLFCGVIASSITRSYPRIGPKQQEIGDKISGYEEGCREQHAANYYVNVARKYGFQKKGAQPGPACNHFNQQRSAQQCANAKTEQRNERICRSRQRVAPQQSPPRNSVRFGGPHETFVECFRNGRTDVSDENRLRGENQDRHGKNKMTQEIPSSRLKRQRLCADGSHSSCRKPVCSHSEQQKSEGKRNVRNDQEHGRCRRNHTVRPAQLVFSAPDT